QVALQVPHAVVKPSSQTSVSGQRTPSPQVDPVPGPVQLALQTPHAVVKPSSQASGPTRSPSPQIAVQRVGVPVQVQPGSRTQVLEQPSPLAMLPSSHCSRPGMMIPSPHTGVQTEGSPEQAQPFSRWHV